MAELAPPRTPEAARALLQVPASFDRRSLRRAYMRAVKRHTPEQDPAGFQAVRTAYDLLLPHASGQAPEERPSRPPASGPPPSSAPVQMEGPPVWVATVTTEVQRRAWTEASEALVVELALALADPGRAAPAATVDLLLQLTTDGPSACARRVLAALRVCAGSGQPAYAAERWAREVGVERWSIVCEMHVLIDIISAPCLRRIARALQDGSWSAAAAAIEHSARQEPAPDLWASIQRGAPRTLAALAAHRAGPDPEPEDPAASP